MMGDATNVADDAQSLPLFKQPTRGLLDEPELVDEGVGGNGICRICRNFNVNGELDVKTTPPAFIVSAGHCTWCSALFRIPRSVTGVTKPAFTQIEIHRWGSFLAALWTYGYGKRGLGPLEPFITGLTTCSQLLQDLYSGRQVVHHVSGFNANSSQGPMNRSRYLGWDFETLRMIITRSCKITLRIDCGWKRHGSTTALADILAAILHFIADRSA